MENKKYTPEEVEDITSREKLCLDFLKEQQMTPSCQISKQNLGDDVFGDRVIPFLQDTKFTNVVSPVQKDELSQAN